MKSPLADRIRPQTLDDIVGQKHLIAQGKPLRNIIDSSNEIPNMIFYGPSGVGKSLFSLNIIASAIREHKKFAHILLEDDPEESLIRLRKIIPQIIFPVKDRMFGVCNDVLSSTKM